MSTRGCILTLSGTDESEGNWEFDLHMDFQRPDELDVMAHTQASFSLAEFTLSLSEVISLRDALDKWIKERP